MLKKILFLVLFVGTFYLNGSARDTTRYVNNYRNCIDANLFTSGYFQAGLNLKVYHRLKPTSWFNIEHGLNIGYVRFWGSYNNTKLINYKFTTLYGFKRNWFLIGLDYGFFFPKSYFYEWENDRGLEKYDTYVDIFVGYHLYSKNYRFNYTAALSVYGFKLGVGYNFNLIKNNTRKWDKSIDGFEIDISNILRTEYINYGGDIYDYRLEWYFTGIAVRPSYKKIIAKIEFYGLLNSLTEVNYGLGYKFVGTKKFELYPIVKTGINYYFFSTNRQFVGFDFEIKLKMNDKVSFTPYIGYKKMSYDESNSLARIFNSELNAICMSLGLSYRIF